MIRTIRRSPGGSTSLESAGRGRGVKNATETLDIVQTQSTPTTRMELTQPPTSLLWQIGATWARTTAPTRAVAAQPTNDTQRTSTRTTQPDRPASFKLVKSLSDPENTGNETSTEDSGKRHKGHWDARQGGRRAQEQQGWPGMGHGLHITTQGRGTKFRGVEGGGTSCRSPSTDRHRSNTARGLYVKKLVTKLKDGNQRESMGHSLY